MVVLPFTGTISSPLRRPLRRTVESTNQLARRADKHVSVGRPGYDRPRLARPQERLADRRVFTLDAKGWDAFVAALDAPPRRHARLERLFREPSVFDPASEP
jgi:hypothetical protein